MNPPSLRDTVVPVRAYLTDEEFGAEHWRAAQFCAPEHAPWAILVIYDSRAARDAALQTFTQPEPAPAGREDSR